MDDFEMGAGAPSGDLGGGAEVGVSAPDAAPLPSYSPEPSEPQQQYDAPPEAPRRPRTMTGTFAKPVDAPAAWPQAVRDKYWQRLDPELQNYFATTEAERHKAFSEYGNRVKAFEPIEKVLSTHIPSLQQRGINDPARAIDQLFYAERAFSQNPVQAAIDCCKGYGVDLVAALKSNAPDPAIQQQVQGAQQQVAEAQQHLQQVAGYAQQVEQRAGQLEQALLQQHSEYQRLQSEFAEFKRVTEAKARAEDARRSARVNVVSGPAYPSPKTMDDDLNEIARRHYG